MANAFNWSPGGCCCAVAQGPFAMGVDDINNPTITRIPKKARITYSGIYADPDIPEERRCGAPDFLNNQVEIFEAFAPSYSLRRILSEYTSGALENYRIQMHWSAASEAQTELPTWPGYAGGTPTFNIGRITRKPSCTVAPQDDGQPNRVVATAGNGPGNMTLNYNTQFPPFGGGWPFYNPPGFSYSNFFGECRELPSLRLGELSLICGGYFGDQDAKNEPTVEAIFTHTFLGTIGLSGMLQPVWHKNLPIEWRLHTFTFETGAPRQQRICVIPDTLQFTIADAVKSATTQIMSNSSNFGGELDQAVIDIVFEEWFEGPLATLP